MSRSLCARAALVAAVGVAAVVATGCTDEKDEASAQDPPRIVPWSAIGNVTLGQPVGRVRDAYGTPNVTRTLHLPVGTKYGARVVTEDTYRVSGGRLVVTYVDGVAKAIQTTSPRNGTRSGIRVGGRVRRGPCRRNFYGSCEYKWRSFTFDECGSTWLRVSRPLEIEVRMDRNLRSHRAGRIDWIRFGDLHVVLHCF